MTPRPLDLAVIIVAHNSRDDLPGCLAGRDRWASDPIRVHTVIVDCASADGSADLVREQFPDIHLVEPGKNLGFAGGNNAGWDYIQTQFPNTQYVALLNPDTVPADHWLDPLIEHLEHHPGTATCQPLITLHDHPDRINTAGNRSHYLGFGLITRCNEPIPDDLATQPIGYSSGAAMLTRANLLTDHGLFEKEMFLYCEDTDLGWKLTQLGYQHDLIPQSCVAHKFQPSGSLKHYYYLERNRLWLLLVYFKGPTLLLLLPAILLMEIGQLLFAMTSGRLHDKLRSWAYFFKWDHRQHIRAQRIAAQQRRTISDKNFTRAFVGGIDHPALRSPLVRFIANPLFAVYWWLARRVIFW